MPADLEINILLASNDPALLRASEGALRNSGGRTTIVLSAESALQALAQERSFALVLMDARLPGMETGQLLAAVRAHPAGAMAPVVLFSDTVTEEWHTRLNEGVLSDVLQPSIAAEFLTLRLDRVLRSHATWRELMHLRESAAAHAHLDALTGTYNRGMVLSLLFRETDRVQRMNTSLSMILFDVDDFGHWNMRLGSEACDNLLTQTAGRVQRLLRSYDLLGRIGSDEFLVGLPGCSAVNGMRLAERIRAEVFGTPFRVAGKALRLSACFAVTVSQGRSPVVILRELEEGLRTAKDAGPETIQNVTEWSHPEAEPVAFLLPTTGDDLLAW